MPSDQQKLLSRAKQGVGKHRRIFLDEVEYIERLEAKQHRIFCANALRIPQVTLSSTSPFRERSTSDSTFPMKIVPSFRNFSFHGRKDLLDGIYNAFTSEAKSPYTGPACFVLFGIGGIGKTSIALEYTYAYENDYDAIFWLRAESGIGLGDSYCAIARKLKLGLQSENKTHIIEEVKEWLEGTSECYVSVVRLALPSIDQRWLLVFDNADDAQDLVPYWPINLKHRGSVIITTQIAGFSPISESFKKVEVPSFTSAEGSICLFKYLERGHLEVEERNSAKELTRLVGGSPLALATIGGYVGPPSNYSLTDFLKDFNKKSLFWNCEDVSTVRAYERSLATVFDIALDELDDDAKRLLEVLAFLDPDGVPEDILRVFFEDSEHEMCLVEGEIKAG